MAMHRAITPSGIAPPLARYSHAMEVAPGLRWVVCSGQIGMDADGSIPGDAERQAELCFGKIKAILAEAGMAVSDIVRINTYVTGREHLKGYQAARDRFVGTPPPASTLLVIAGLSRPELFVEIEVLAAKA
jgi:enamine deaminase RidA (YjgF/YER057c/UK114 family)